MFATIIRKAPIPIVYVATRIEVSMSILRFLIIDIAENTAIVAKITVDAFLLSLVSFDMADIGDKVTTMIS
ncbi:hypothetical protein A7J57_15085 [Agrobacterium tumefaciens]|uniref:Uncharacterized protein n=1 Tax=Agrobacterium tumefaciens TaxID=358 RepID=A0A176XGL4_AGRTU|nr:hypothetical protein A7J57_15085 [Agrobacterium tumefaciens]